MTYDLTDEVRAIGSLNFEGNITPIEWFSHIRLPNNKPDLVSINLLSDIVYWYRPTTVRDELSGKVISYRKKFKSDLLQKGYADIEAFFGLSKDQIKKSLQRLEQLNLIKRVFRNIKCNGSSLANVMFIQIFPTNIINITQRNLGLDFDSDLDFDLALNFNASINTQTSEHSYPGVRVNKPTPPGINTHTYTETTTKITTNNSLSFAASTKINKKSQKPKPTSLVEPKRDKREIKMLKIWNEVVEVNNEASIQVTPKRANLLSLRLKEAFNNDVSLWKDFCLKIASSKFLMGEVTSFKVQLDWALKEENMLKIIENSYGVGDRSINAPSSISVENIEQELLIEIQNSNNSSLWQTLQTSLLKKRGAATFKSWFSKNQFVGFRDGILEIKSFSKFGASFLNEHYFDDIVSICKQANSEFAELRITY